MTEHSHGTGRHENNPDLSDFSSSESLLEDYQNRINSDASFSSQDHALLVQLTAIYETSGDSEKFLQAAELCQTVGEKALPVRDMRLISNKDRLATAQFANGKHFSAIATLSEAVEEAERYSLGSAESRIQMCLKLTRFCHAAEDYQEGLRWGVRADQIATANPEGNIALQMAAKLSCSQSHKYLGDYTESGRSFIEAYDMLRSFGELEGTAQFIRNQARDVIRVVQSMAESCQASQQFYEAELLTREMCRLITFAPDRSDWIEAEIREEYAQALWNNGKFEEAGEIFKEIDPVLLQETETPSGFLRQLNRAILAGERGDSLEEERRLKRLANSFQTSPSPAPFELINTEMLLARAQLSQGRALAASQTIESAWQTMKETSPPAIYEAIKGEIDDLIPTIRDILNEAPASERASAKLCLRLASELLHVEGSATHQLKSIQSITKAETDFSQPSTEESLNALRKSHYLKKLLGRSIDPETLGRSAYSLSQILKATGDEDSGIELIEEALELARPEKPSALPGLTYMQIATGNARLARGNGDYTTAEELLEEAETILARFPRHAMGALKASLREEQGKLYLALGRREEAVEALEEAEGILQGKGDDSSPAMLTVQTALGSAYEEAGRIEDAQRASGRVDAIIAALQFENQPEDLDQ